jgi:hypothetical protein
MPKITVFFKDKPINSYQFEQGIVRIGRDDTNDITVDSLAVAPAHSVIVISETGNTIKQLNDNFPLIINGENFKESNLNNGDKITIGKHSIIFDTNEAFVRTNNTEKLADQDLFHLNQEIEASLKLPEANMQVMDGKHIGRMIPLKRSMTRLGSVGGGIAVIAKRKDGYFISSLEGEDSLKVNDTCLSTNTIKLNDNDTVVIDNTTMQFFFS